MNKLNAPSYRWLVLLASIYATITYAFSFMGIPPLITPIMQDFGISYAQAGLLMSMAIIPGILLPMLVDELLTHYGVRLVGSIASIFIVIGCFITAVSSSFYIALIGRLILSCGGTVIVTAAPMIIATWFPHEELGKAMGIYTTGMPIASTSSYLLANTFTVTQGWRYQFYIGTMIALVNLVLVFLIVKKGPINQERQDQNNHGMAIRQHIKNIEIWKAGALWFLFSCSIVSFTTWAPSLFVNFKSIDPGYANTIISAFWLIQIPGCLVFGWISDRLGKRRPLLITGCIVIVIFTLSLIYPINTILVATLTLLLGFLAMMIPPNIMATPPEILGLASAGVGFGVLEICLNVGNGLGPPLIGLILDLTQSPAFSLMGIAMFPAFGLLFAYVLKIK